MRSKTFGSAVYLWHRCDNHKRRSKCASGHEVFFIGLADSAVKESEQKVESSIKHVSFTMPRQKVVVNLAQQIY